MATSRQHMQSTLRSAEEQNAINARLLRSMLQRDKTAFQQALAEGANPNAMGVVLAPGRKPSTNPPLFSAIYAGDVYFVKGLIAAGADVSLEATNRESPIDLAISRGHHDMVEALLQKDPGLIDSDGVNLVIHAVLSFSAMALMKHSFLTPEQRNALSAFYKGEVHTLPADLANMTLDYRGNQDVLRVLFKYPASHRRVLGETPLEGREGSVSPWQLIHNPGDYIPEFLDPGINAAGTVRCLSTPDDTQTNGLLFEVAFIPVGKNLKHALWLKVRYDFSDLIKTFEPIVEKLRPNHALQHTMIDMLLELHENMKLVHREVERGSPYFQEIENLSPMQGRHYDALAKHLAIMLQGYQTMSSGLMQRKKNTKMDNASSIIAFVAGQAPSPWGLPFGVVSAGLSVAADIKEQRRYARIADALPADTRPIAQELAYKITCIIDAKLGSFPQASSLDGLMPAQVDALAKRAFVLAINVIHNLKDTDIDKSASASKKADELMTLVLQAVEADRKHFLNQLMVHASKNALVFSTAANGHAHNGHSPHNGDTPQALRKNASSCKKATWQVFPLK